MAKGAIRVATLVAVVEEVLSVMVVLLKGSQAVPMQQTPFGGNLVVRFRQRLLVLPAGGVEPLEAVQDRLALTLLAQLFKVGAEAEAEGHLTHPTQALLALLVVVYQVVVAVVVPVVRRLRLQQVRVVMVLRAQLVAVVVAEEAQVVQHLELAVPEVRALNQRAVAAGEARQPMVLTPALVALVVQACAASTLGKEIA